MVISYVSNGQEANFKCYGDDQAQSLFTSQGSAPSELTFTNTKTRETLSFEGKLSELPEEAAPEVICPEPSTPFSETQIQPL